MKIEEFRELLEKRLNTLDDNIHNVHVKLLNYPSIVEEETAHDLSVSFENYLHWAKDYTNTLIGCSLCNYRFIVEREVEREECKTSTLGSDSLDLLNHIYNDILFIKYVNRDLLERLVEPEVIDEKELECNNEFKYNIDLFTNQIIYELDEVIKIVKKQYDSIVNKEYETNTEEDKMNKELKHLKDIKAVIAENYSDKEPLTCEQKDSKNCFIKYIKEIEQSLKQLEDIKELEKQWKNNKISQFDFCKGVFDVLEPMKWDDLKDEKED